MASTNETIIHLRYSTLYMDTPQKTIYVDIPLSPILLTDKIKGKQLEMKFYSASQLVIKKIKLVWVLDKILT
jgi:hypothetical protein